jgi:hypothetical protein
MIIAEAFGGPYANPGVPCHPQAATTLLPRAPALQVRFSFAPRHRPRMVVDISDSRAR